MTEEEILRDGFAVPLTSPAYSKAEVKFVDREFLNIVYRTDRAALERVVPAPLQPVGDTVRYEFIRMPDATGLGDYTESGQVIPVTFRGESGGYTHCMYVDDFGAIASGREIMGYPKLLAAPKLEVRRDCLVGTLDYNGVRLATATMGYKTRALDVKAVEKTMRAPGFLLKLIPHVDMRSLRVCELIRFTLGDLVVKGAWTGPAALELHPHALAPVASLPVREVVSATHILADLSLGAAEVVYDYLAARATAGARSSREPWPDQRE